MEVPNPWLFQGTSDTAISDLVNITAVVQDERLAFNVLVSTHSDIIVGHGGLVTDLSVSDGET